MRRLLQNKAITYALIVNLIGSVLLPMVANASNTDNRVLVCTPQGFEWVTVEIAQELTLGSEEGTTNHCFYCQNANGEEGADTLLRHSTIVFLSDNKSQQSPDLLLRCNSRYAFSQSRAPPVFI